MTGEVSLAVRTFRQLFAILIALCYASYCQTVGQESTRLTTTPPIKPIVVYLVERHPLDLPEIGPVFRWLKFDNNFIRDLEGLIGPIDEDHVTLVIDKEPVGTAWDRLLEGLLSEDIQMVITHLAPLSSAQRQQLIGICAQSGAQLITPGDAGRNR